MGLKDKVKVVYQNSDVLFTFDQDAVTQMVALVCIKLFYSFI